MRQHVRPFCLCLGGRYRAGPCMHEEETLNAHRAFYARPVPTQDRTVRRAPAHRVRLQPVRRRLSSSGAVLYFVREGSCDATDRQLGQRCGKSVPAIKRSLRELEAKKWIERLSGGGPSRLIRPCSPGDPTPSDVIPYRPRNEPDTPSDVIPNRLRTPISAAGNSPTPRQMLDHFYIQDNDAIIACNPGRNSVLDPSRLHGRPAAGGLV